MLNGCCQLCLGAMLKDGCCIVTGIVFGSPFWLKLLLALSRPIPAACRAAALLLVLLM
jgi:hypothetical protein